MTAPLDISKIKPGDEVLLRFVVSAAPSGVHWPHVEIDPSGQLDGGVSEGSYLSAGLAAIAGHTPKTLAVGDRVKYLGQVLGTIIAVDGPEAWVRFASDDERSTYRLSDLERVS